MPVRGEGEGCAAVVEVLSLRKDVRSLNKLSLNISDVNLKYQLCCTLLQQDCKIIFLLLSHYWNFAPASYSSPRAKPHFAPARMTAIVTFSLAVGQRPSLRSKGTHSHAVQKTTERREVGGLEAGNGN